jgi:hypothetical protein
MVGSIASRRTRWAYRLVISNSDSISVSDSRCGSRPSSTRPVQRDAEHGVIVIAGRQPVVPGGLVLLLPVDHALVEVGRAQMPITLLA